jgi:hypothetical protein
MKGKSSASASTFETFTLLDVSEKSLAISAVRRQTTSVKDRISLDAHDIFMTSPLYTMTTSPY